MLSYTVHSYNLHKTLYRQLYFLCTQKSALKRLSKILFIHVCITHTPQIKLNLALKKKCVLYRRHYGICFIDRL